MNALFNDYFIKKTPNAVSIRGKIAYQGLEKFGSKLMMGMFYLFLPLVPYYWPLTVPNAIWIKLVLMIALFAVSYKLVNKYVAPFITAMLIVKVDTKAKTLSLPMDKFQTELTAITKLSIIEEQAAKEADEKYYRLKLKLTDGEKVSTFAFTSYNKLDEILTVIKNGL
jgi:hypothetical protein